MRNVSDKSCKDKTYILCSIPFFENRDIYEIMWKNMVKPDRPQMAIWRRRFACWINKVTDICSEYVIFIAQCYVHNYTFLSLLLCSSLNIFFLVASPNN
jgi:hypothetical protein